MDRFDISILGMRLVARGRAGILGCIVLSAIVLGFALLSAWQAT